MQIGYLSKHFKNECRQNAAWFDKSVYCVYEELLCLGWWTRHSGHCPQEFTVTDRHKFFFVFTLGHFPIAEREREREDGRERIIDGRENHRWERETLIGCRPYVPGPGIIHSRTRGCTHNLGMCLIGNGTTQPFRYGMALPPTEPHCPGHG